MMLYKHVGIAVRAIYTLCFLVVLLRAIVFMICISLQRNGKACMKPYPLE